VKPKLLAWLAGIVILSVPSLLWASKPMDEIRVVVNQALEIVKKSNLESKPERKKLVGD
jgi:hypothetical protein